MASAIVKHLDEITECPICTNSFVDPKVLPCIHTFCLKCLENWGKQKEAAEELPCPLCRKSVAIPDGGFNSFPRNFFVEKLLEVRKLSTALSHKDVVCQVCCDTDNTSPGGAKTAMVYCTDCRLNMCQQCFTHHKKIKLSSTHRFIELDKQLQDNDLLNKFPESLCHQHDETLKLYCFDCSQPACVMCYITSHNSHKCSDVKIVSEELSSQIASSSDAVATKTGECREMLQKLEKQQKAFMDSIIKTENEISDAAEKMKQLVDDYKCKLLNELQTVKNEQEKKTENAKQEVERMLLMLESFQKYASELRSKGTACDIARASSGLRDRAKELVELDVGREFVSSVNVKFTSHLSALKLQHLFGELQIDRTEVVSDSQATDLTDDFVGDIKPAHTIPGTGKGVAGITSLGDELFVVRSFEKHIDVYDAASLSLRRSLSVSGSSSSVDRGLAACPTNKCIYMSDWSAHKIYRVELTGNNTVTSWSVGQGPLGLSVNADCNVIVACYSANKLQEFTTRGSLVREISLQSDITNPVNVVQFSSGQFGVTHCGSLHCYCLVETNGRVIKSYGGASGSGVGQMNFPVGLAVNKAGAVFIADRNNNRILKLDPSTFSASELTVEGGLAYPYCLHYDKSRGRLYVGELMGGYRVVVFGK